MQATQLKYQIEEKVNDLYPNGKPADKGYVSCLEEIVTSNRPRFTYHIEVMTFRESITEIMSIESFLEGINGLYPELSEKANHEMRVTVPNFPIYERVIRLQTF